MIEQNSFTINAMKQILGYKDEKNLIALDVGFKS
jgi:hypothetical protein